MHVIAAVGGATCWGGAFDRLDRITRCTRSAASATNASRSRTDNVTSARSGRSISRTRYTHPALATRAHHLIAVYDDVRRSAEDTLIPRQRRAEIAYRNTGEEDVDIYDHVTAQEWR